MVVRKALVSPQQHHILLGDKQHVMPSPIGLSSPLLHLARTRARLEKWCPCLAHGRGGIETGRVVAQCHMPTEVGVHARGEMGCTKALPRGGEGVAAGQQSRHVHCVAGGHARKGPVRRWWWAATIPPRLMSTIDELSAASARRFRHCVRLR